MQELVSWFVVISFIILFFGISMNIYNAFFSDVVLVSDDIHISDRIENNKLNNKKRIKQKQIIKKETHSIEKMNAAKHKDETKLRRKSAVKDVSNSSKTYTRKYTSYKEFKKYNSVSR